jgi:hypothetical protein
MSVKSKAYFEQLFVTGYTPTQQDYQDLWDTLAFGPWFDIPIKVGLEVGTDYSVTFPANTFIAKVSAINGMGNPRIRIGTHQGGSEILSNYVLTDDGIIVDINERYPTGVTLYFHLTGSSQPPDQASIRIDFVSNYY